MPAVIVRELSVGGHSAPGFARNRQKRIARDGALRAFFRPPAPESRLRHRLAYVTGRISLVSLTSGFGRLRLRVDSGIGSLMLPAEFPCFVNFRRRLKRLEPPFKPYRPRPAHGLRKTEQTGIGARLTSQS
jgi:hypothetical protein